MRENTHGTLRIRTALLAAAAAMAAAFAISGCTTVMDGGGSAPNALLRVIDASYIAPAANVYLQNKLFAGNVGQGTITAYSAVSSSAAALVKVTPASGTTPAVTASVTLNPGTQHTVLITDNGAAATQYIVTVLADQSTAAPAGKSDFRFLNQAPSTGAVDIYMVPDGTELTDAKPLVTNLAVGATTAYIPFSSQTVDLVITPTGTTKAKFTSATLALVGGEVRTVVIVDSQLTTDPPVQALIADDLN